MKVKICGITTLDDALAAIDAGADLLGFNFYPRSPRYIEPAACAALVNHLRGRGERATLVGVFVNIAADAVAACLDACNLDYAQLHGDEPPEDLAALGAVGVQGHPAGQHGGGQAPGVALPAGRA